MDINQHIENVKGKLEDPTVSPQSRRHSEEELKDLEKYKENHPGDDHDPTALELFCDSHPDDDQCKIYDL